MKTEYNFRFYEYRIPVLSYFQYSKGKYFLVAIILIIFLGQPLLNSCSKKTTASSEVKKNIKRPKCNCD